MDSMNGFDPSDQPEQEWFEAMFFVGDENDGLVDGDECPECAYILEETYQGRIYCPNCSDTQGNIDTDVWGDDI